MNVFVLIYLKTWTYSKTQHNSMFNSGLNSIVKKRFVIWVDSIKFPRALSYTLVPQKSNVLFINWGMFAPPSPFVKGLKLPLKSWVMHILVNFLGEWLLALLSSPHSWVEWVCSWVEWAYLWMEHARSIVQNNLKGNLLEAKLLLVWVSLPTSMGFHFHIYMHMTYTPHTHNP